MKTLQSVNFPENRARVGSKVSCSGSSPLLQGLTLPSQSGDVTQISCTTRHTHKIHEPISEAEDYFGIVPFPFRLHFSIQLPIIIHIPLRCHALLTTILGR